MATPKVILSLPPDSHPDCIRGTYINRDEGLLGLAKGAMQSMYEVYDKVNTLGMSVRDKSKLAREALPHIERVASKVGRSIEQLRARRVQLDKELHDKIVGDGRDHMGGEIRTFLRTLPRGDAVVKVADAARVGDRQTVAAALSGPTYLSGMTPEQREVLRGLARNALEPDSTGLLADVDTNLARVEQAHEVFMTKTASHIREWQSQDDALISKALGGAA